MFKRSTCVLQANMLCVIIQQGRRGKKRLMLCTNATMHGYAITAQYVADSSISEMYCFVIDVWCGFVTVIFYHLPTWRDIYQDNALQTTLNVKNNSKSAKGVRNIVDLDCCKTVQIHSNVHVDVFSRALFISLTYCIINSEGVDIVRGQIAFFLSLSVTVHLKYCCGPLSKKMLNSSDWNLTGWCHNRFLWLLMYIIFVTQDIMDGSLVPHHKQMTVLVMVYN